MILLPAMDLYDGKVVRLYQGDYQQMTVYSDHPLETASEIEKAGAAWLHVVDLKGARDGTTPAHEVISSIAHQTSLKIEAGGGIRTMDAIEQYLSLGVSRVILGSAAVTDETFLRKALNTYGSERIAVGVDARNEKVAIHGWKEETSLDMMEFLHHLETIGVRTVVCTDISKDGAMKGTNLSLYQKLSGLHLDIIASGGVSSLEDIRNLKKCGCYGAILGKAMYTHAVDLKEALQEAQA